jgi:hypothetical protein
LDSVHVESFLAFLCPQWTILGTSACEKLQIHKAARKLFPPDTEASVVHKKKHAIHFQSVGAVLDHLQVNRRETFD